MNKISNLVKKNLLVVTFSLFFYFFLNLISAVDITSCVNITSNGYYNLSKNINSSANCININSSNVMLECHGYTLNVTQRNIGIGIYAYNVNNVTIRNCNMLIQNTSTTSIGKSAIAFLNVSNSTILNNTINTWCRSASTTIGCYGINLTRTISINISNNNITSQVGAFSQAIRLIDANSSWIANNNLNGTVASYYGIYTLRAGQNNIVNNYIWGSGTGSSLYLTFARSNNITNNKLVGLTSSTSVLIDGSNIFLTSSILNNFTGNNLTHLNNLGIRYAITDALTQHINYIDQTNYFNGLPILYLKDNTSFSLVNQASPYGQIIIDNSSNSNFYNVSFNTTKNGISVYYSINMTIDSSNLTTLYTPLYIYNMTNSNVNNSNFLVTYAVSAGIYASTINYNNFTNLTINVLGSSVEAYGIILSTSRYNRFNGINIQHPASGTGEAISATTIVGNYFNNINLNRTTVTATNGGFSFITNCWDNIINNSNIWNNGVKSYPIYIIAGKQNLTIINSNLTSIKNSTILIAVSISYINSTITLINTNWSELNVTFENMNARLNTTIFNYNYLSINVTETTTKLPINQANASVYFNNGTWVDNDTTGIDGFIYNIPVLEFVWNNSANWTYQLNYTINVTKDGFANYTGFSINISQNQRADINITDLTSGSTPDTSEPIFSNYLEYPLDPTEYSPDKLYNFSVTIINNNGTASIEFNGVNYTMFNVTDSFNRSLLNLGAGTYYYYYWAYGNGTSHNYNNSNTLDYTINKNSSYGLALSVTSPITYGSSTDFTSSGCPPQLSCTLNLTNQVFPAGTISANYSSAGNSNYTAKSQVATVTINQGTGIVNGTINGTQGNFSAVNGLANRNIYLNATNKTGYGTGKIYLNGTIINSGTMPLFNITNLSEGFYNITFIYDGNNNYTSSTDIWWVNISQGADTTNPSIIFNSQTPSDINAFNLFGIPLNITYNITDDRLLNTSTIRLYYKTNKTTSDISYYENGTAISGYRTKTYTSNASDTYLFRLFDNQVYPATYNINETQMENTTHSQLSLSSMNDAVKVRIYNISNISQYGFIEIDAENTSAFITPRNLDIYYCNSSYLNMDITSSTSCYNFNSISTTEIYNHTHSVNSKHFVKTFAINITDGTIGTIKVTSISYFIFNSQLVGLDSWKIDYIADDTGTIQTSNNLGLTYSNQAGTVDMHIHQFDGTDTLRYYVCANDSSNNTGCSSIKNDLLDTAGLPPNNPHIYSPSGIYPINQNLNINYTTSISPNDYPIVKYNISLMNNDLTFNRTIYNNNSNNLSYIWNPSFFGTFIIRVEACDNLNQCSFGYSDNFSIVKDASSCNMLFNETSPLTYNAKIKAYANCGIAVIYLNGTVIANNSEQSLGAGNWNFTVTRNDTQNYSNILSTSIFTINKATTSLGLTGTTPIVYPTITDFAGTGCNAQIVCSLNLTNRIYQTGTVSANYSTSGGQNYSGSSAVATITINQNNTWDINLTASPSWIEQEGTQTTVTNSTACPSELLCKLYRNNVLVSNPDIQTLVIGIYNYTFNSTGNTNYSAKTISRLLNITSLPDTAPPTWINLRNISHNINTEFSESITASDPSGIDSYVLNDTSTFNIDKDTGLITNITYLTFINAYYLTITVNDTLGNTIDGTFYIDIIVPSGGTTIVSSNINKCRYKKLGYYNLKIPYMKENYNKLGYVSSESEQRCL